MLHHRHRLAFSRQIFDHDDLLNAVGFVVPPKRRPAEPRIEPAIKVLRLKIHMFNEEALRSFENLGTERTRSSPATPGRVIGNR